MMKSQPSLSRYRGRTPEEALEIFRSSVAVLVDPTKGYPSFLGEVIVHARMSPSPWGVADSRRRCATGSCALLCSEDFAVNSKNLARDSGAADDADRDENKAYELK